MRRRHSTVVKNTKNHHVTPTAQQLVVRGPLFVTQPLVKMSTTHPPNMSPDIDSNVKVLWDYEPNKNDQVSSVSDKARKGKIDKEDSKAPLHHSHAVMVGVPLEIAVAVALASFVIGAALTGILCCIHHKKSTPKMLRHGDGVDPSTEGSELQSMIASPTLQPQLLHISHHHNGSAAIAT